MKAREIPKEVSKYFIYNPQTGIIKRKITVNNRAKKGSIVGSLRSHGYLTTSYDYKQYYIHRLAWFLHHGNQPEYIDHINGIKTDNRLANLRNCSNSQNNMNVGKMSNNTSGHTGVYWIKDRKSWKAVITVNYKTIYLIMSKDKDTVINARKQAEIKYFGEYRYKKGENNVKRKLSKRINMHEISNQKT